MLSSVTQVVVQTALWTAISNQCSTLSEQVCLWKITILWHPGENFQEVLLQQIGKMFCIISVGKCTVKTCQGNSGSDLQTTCCTLFGISVVRPEFITGHFTRLNIFGRKMCFVKTVN